MVKKARSYYQKGEESSSLGRSYGGGKEGSGHGGGYPSKAEVAKKGPAYRLGERVLEGRSFKAEGPYVERDKDNVRGTRLGKKSKSQRAGQRKRAA